jgi:hypothetical protein
VVAYFEVIDTFADGDNYASTLVANNGREVCEREVILAVVVI